MDEIRSVLKEMVYEHMAIELAFKDGEIVLADETSSIPLSLEGPDSEFPKNNDSLNSEHELAHQGYKQRKNAIFDLDSEFGDADPNDPTTKQILIPSSYTDQSDSFCTDSSA